jgi:hypothetical protein
VESQRGGNIAKDVTNSAPKLHRDARSAAKFIETSNNEVRRFGAQSARRNLPVTSLGTLTERWDISREQHIRWIPRHDSYTVFTVGAITTVLNTASGFADTSISVYCPDGYIDNS